jgi:lipoprotein-anchoring transpeptidase ErfK/SrfK
MRCFVGVLIAGALISGSAAARTMDVREVNDAVLSKSKSKVKGSAIDPVILRAQVLLDRLRFSPGVIDGRPGDNVREAIRAFEEANGLSADGELDPETFARLTQSSADPVIVEHELTAEDVKGPFAKSLPKKLEEMAELKAMPYRTALEKLAERFHASEALLKALNPGADFERAGVVIAVPAVRPAATKDVVARIEVDKPGRRLRALDDTGKLIAVYPATIGSDDKPAPSGAHEVRAIAVNPTYTYNPDFKFKGVKARKAFEVPAGPNNPVGAVWIDLSAETYGIHGTPEPEKVGKSVSNGCVRLTNWDALDLAAMVKKKAAVVFSE